MIKKNGISLMLLVITIIVAIILSGTVILTVLQNNPVTQASRVAFETDLEGLKDELNAYISEQNIFEEIEYSSLRLQADENSLTYDGIIDTNKTINDILPSLIGIVKYYAQFEIVNGKLVFKGTDTNEKEWAEEMGIGLITESEFNVTIVSASEPVVKSGTDVIYTVTFSSNAGISNIDLTDKIALVYNNGSVVPIQPTLIIGSATGTASDYIRSVDITIKTDILPDETYKLKIKAGSATNENNISNIDDTISLVSFNVDNIAPSNPIMLADVVNWTNGDVIVTITYSIDSVTNEYSVDGTTWNTYTAPVNITTNNTIVYAKGIDEAGNQSGQSTLTVANIDKILPIITYGTNGGATTSASTTVTASDLGGSDINAGTLQYVWDTQNTITPTSGWITFTNGGIITNDNTSGIYYLWINVNDNAGNNTVSVTNAFTLISMVNKPVLATGMTAKIWNPGTTTWDTVANADTDTSWYNYDNKQWANAQTADGSMWVWIPRYEYKIISPHTSTAQSIAVNILGNTTTAATSGYLIHPAFAFRSIELTGIWVAKFEASGSTSAVDSKPGVASLRSTTMNNLFTACRNMETTNGTRYGWGTSGTGIDTHLIKNIEWGAVAYLSSSIYGNSAEIAKNASTSYYTGGGTGTSYVTNVAQSTTGNVYGIYDMSGGAYEYTAAYVNNGNSSLTTSGLSLVNATNEYKDIYISSGDTQAGNYTASSNKLGDAVYETSTSGAGSTSWYGDYSDMSYSSFPFFARGGHYSVTTSAGVFAFSYINGQALANLGFRPTLIVSGTL